MLVIGIMSRMVMLTSQSHLFFLLMSASNMCSGRIGSLYGTNIGNVLGGRLK